VANFDIGVGFIARSHAVQKIAGVEYGHRQEYENGGNCVIMSNIDHTLRLLIRCSPVDAW
jgi:hypothetical protein